MDEPQSLSANGEAKYRILAELGEGGTAKVRLAVASGPSGFSKLVVLKSLKQHLSDEQEFRTMFLNEARLAARLNHPNIVQTNEVAEEGGLPIIVMEYLDGAPLSSVLARARGSAFTQAMHLRVIADALAGLHFAHELADFDGTRLDVVHRDMTPHNVFITYIGQVKILDFGIAKLNSSRAETQTGVIKGKVRYMPPEQLTGEPIDRRADIFSVGVMLWEAAVGDRMWNGMSDTTIMQRVVNGDIPAPRSVNPDVPLELERIVMKALSPSREGRYASAAELETAIEQFLVKVGPVTARHVGKVVSGLFEDTRRKTKALIEAQLSRVASMSWHEYEVAEAPIINAFTSLTSSATGPAVTGSVSRIDNRGARRQFAWIGIAAVLLAGAAWGIADTRENARPSSTPVLAAPAPLKAADRPEQQSITVRLSVSPIEAKLYMDDQALPSNPFVQTMRRDGTRHIVRAEAEGYQVSTAAVVLDKDADVLLILQRKPEQQEKDAKRVPAQHARRTSRVAAKPAQPVTSSTPLPQVSKSPNCELPYFVDAQRIKRFKPECM